MRYKEGTMIVCPRCGGVNRLSAYIDPKTGEKDHRYLYYVCDGIALLGVVDDQFVPFSVNSWRLAKEGEGDEPV